MKIMKSQQNIDIKYSLNLSSSHLKPNIIITINSMYKKKQLLKVGWTGATSHLTTKKKVLCTFIEGFTKKNSCTTDKTYHYVKKSTSNRVNTKTELNKKHKSIVYDTKK